MSRRDTLHAQIAERLRQRILDRQYGTEMPREIDLATEFQVSRHTMRTALQQLVSEGLIERRAGSGTRITDRAQGGIWVIGALGDLIGEFSPSQYLTLIAQDVDIADHPIAMKLFAEDGLSRIFHILRLLLADGQPYALADIYARADLAARVPKELLGEQPLITLLEQHARARPTRARQVATAEAATPAVARQLGLEAGDPVLRLKRTYLDAEDSAILHTELSCRPDLYEQVVDFVHETPS